MEMIANQMICIEELNSSGIEAEMRSQGLNEIKFLGSYLPLKQHPNVCDADARIWIYEFPNRYKVADTNGDPIWEAEDLQAWEEVMADYGVE